ncbi:hypothetical protein ACCQ12_15425 [Xanthomonas sp. NCPPB 1068]|uniref:hypothetical protein n=1 Tax=Xanthomonas sp. NCPPB 1068 TaxID=487525 RepID=UPI0035575A70
MSELSRYTKAMISGDIDACMRIEQLHDLHGYPPEMVTVGLRAADNGEDPVIAVETYIEDQA